MLMNFMKSLSSTAVNIPFYKLQNVQFCTFLEKYTSKNTPDECLLKKIIFHHTVLIRLYPI